MSETWGFRLIKFSNWYDFTRTSMRWNVQTCLLFNGKTAFPWRILWQSQRRSQSSHRNGEKVPMASSDGYMFVPPLFQLRILTAASTLRHTSTTTGGLGETWSEYKLPWCCHVDPWWFLESRLRSQLDDWNCGWFGCSKLLCVECGLSISCLVQGQFFCSAVSCEL